jgi:hypothetical protein
VQALLDVHDTASRSPCSTVAREADLTAHARATPA